MSVPDLDAVVIGAGAAGLAAGATLAGAGLAVRVLEAAPRPGGVVRSECVRGYLFERGPNTLQLKPRAVPFLRESGLLDRLERAAPASRRRYLVRAGRLVPVPLGPGAFVTTPLLSPRGKLRLLAEPFVRRGDPTGESVAEFVARRLGREALERLVGPFLTGIYAGDERRLGAEAVFPSLVDAERRHGSIVRGVVVQAFVRRGERTPRGSVSTRRGLGGVVAALAERLGPALVLNTRVVTLAREPRGFLVESQRANGESETLRARSVVVATPAAEAAALLAALDADAARALETIDYAPVASVSLALDPARVRERLDGFGFLMPRGEGEALLGCLFMSALFPERAPAGRALVTALIGGARAPDAVDCPDDRLVAMLRGELDRVLGLGQEPELLGVTRWPRAVPQPGPEHPRRVADVRTRLARCPGLELAGAYLEGVALGDTLASGAEAAARVIALLRS